MTTPREAMRADKASKVKNSEIYDHAADPIWQFAVYSNLHGGWELANIGGRDFLEHVISYGQLGRTGNALDFGSGTGAACRYLVERTGCHATGIEINAHQIDHARRRLQLANQFVADRISFIQTDLRTWTPTTAYDVGYQLDTFSLIPDTNTVLTSCRRALAPGGRFLMADMVAGPNITADDRRYAWATDGFVSLHHADQVAEMMAAARFRVTALADHTADAVAAFASIAAAVRTPPREAPASVSPIELANWTKLADRYIDAFERKAFEYVWIDADAA